jgi:hypothetical protein
MRGRLFVLVLLTGTIVPVSSAFASEQPSSGANSIGIRLLAEPGVPSTNPLARSYVFDQLAPGASLTRTVEIDNTTSATADISVYPAGASIVGGKFSFAPGTSQDELSSWTSFSSDIVRLAPGTKATDTLTIKVPSNAPSGERYAVLWAQVSSSLATAGGVEEVNRVGVRMYVSIGPGGAPPSNFAIRSLTAERSNTGARLVVATVDNTGQSTLDIGGNVTLSRGPGGLRAGPFAASLGTALAPHASELVTAPIDSALPRGPWRADLSLTSVSIHRSAIATLTFPLNNVAKAGSHLWTFVLIALLALLAVAASLLLRLFGRRSRHGVHTAPRGPRLHSSPAGRLPPSTKPSMPGSPPAARHPVLKARMVLNGTRTNAATSPAKRSPN